MNKRSIIFYWLLLIIPTFIIGITAFGLLRHEQERIDQSFRSSMLDRVRAIAETIQITVEAVEDELTDALHRLPLNNNLTDALLTWETNNPLIRNVFI